MKDLVGIVSGADRAGFALGAFAGEGGGRVFAHRRSLGRQGQ
ncbi:hypothetical protein [Kitasatospora sp. NPDC054795]